MKPQALFISGRQGRLFTVYHANPTRPPRYRVLLVPPFGEELNKCRRLLALTARRLCSIGCDVLMSDLFGTGDSEGEFREAAWPTWVSDLETAHEWFADRAPDTASAVVAVRTGVLLLAQMIENSPSAFERVLLWQPVLNGEQFLSQFLRLRVMASRFAGHDESAADLRRRLETGEGVEVGGYEMTPAMAAALRTSTADGLRQAERCRVDVMEFKTGTGGDVSLPSRKLVEQLNANGIEAFSTMVVADAFWATQEITAPSEVVTGTVDLLFADSVDNQQ